CLESFVREKGHIRRVHHGNAIDIKTIRIYIRLDRSYSCAPDSQRVSLHEHGFLQKLSADFYLFRKGRQVTKDNSFVWIDLWRNDKRSSRRLTMNADCHYYYIK